MISLSFTHQQNVSMMKLWINLRIEYLNNKLPKIINLTSSSILVLILICFTISHIQGNYILDLLNHFRPHLIVIAIITLILNFRIYGKRTISLLILFLVLLNFHMFNFSFPTKQTINETPIKALHINLLMGNDNYDAVRKLIINENPDIISLQECTPDWYNELLPILNQYHCTKKIIDSPFGICVASKIPVVSSEIKYLNNQSPPLIKLNLEHNGDFITLYSIHPTPPFNQTLFESRNEYFDLFIDEVGNDESIIIIGDMNITQWSPYYQNFTKKLNIKNSKFVRSSTWPEFLPIQIFQLDHILVSEGFETKNSKVMNSVGSDHLPIVSEIVIRTNLLVGDE